MYKKQNKTDNCIVFLMIVQLTNQRHIDVCTSLNQGKEQFWDHGRLYIAITPYHN